MAKTTKPTGYILPDVNGVPDGAFDMWRSPRTDTRPAPTGDHELDVLVGLYGLESHDVQPPQAGFSLATPAGDIPIGLKLDADGQRIVERCKETLAARRAWHKMLGAVDADPKHPPAWATTISTIVADPWLARGGRLPDLHTQIWARSLMEQNPFNPPETELERRAQMVASYVEVPGYETDENIGVSAAPGGSRMRLRILGPAWAIVDASWMMINVDDVGDMPARAIKERIGKPLSATLKPGSIPILGDFDPTVLDIKVRHGDAYIVCETRVAPMGRPPRAALEAVGLAEAPPAHLCAWWVASRRNTRS